MAKKYWKSRGIFSAQKSGNPALQRTPLDRDPLGHRLPWTQTPRKIMGPGTETLPEGTWDQAARQEVTSYRDPPMDRQTPLKALPCPKLHLWAVIREGFVGVCP